MKNTYVKAICILLSLFSMTQASADEWIRFMANDGQTVNENRVEPPTSLLSPERYFWFSVFSVCSVIMQEMGVSGRVGSCYASYDALKQGHRSFYVAERYTVPVNTEEIYWEDNWVKESETVTQEKPRYEAEFGGSYDNCRDCTLSGILGRSICSRGNSYCRQPVGVSVFREFPVNRPVSKARMVTVDKSEFSYACFSYQLARGLEMRPCDSLADPRNLGALIAPLLKGIR